MPETQAAIIDRIGIILAKLDRAIEIGGRLLVSAEIQIACSPIVIERGRGLVPSPCRHRPAGAGGDRGFRIGLRAVVGIGGECRVRDPEQCEQSQTAGNGHGRPGSRKLCRRKSCHHSFCHGDSHPCGTGRPHLKYPAISLRRLHLTSETGGNPLTQHPIFRPNGVIPPADEHGETPLVLMEHQFF